MGQVAFLFAGQGAQHPGMCMELAEREPAARAVFETADTVRPGTSAQCFEGTQEELNDTANTQPCVFAADLACARALETHGVAPAAVAGFSLGEVAALTFAGSYTDAEGFALVCHRAELMAAAAEGLAQQAGEAWPVNYNSPQQTVVAGAPAALEKLDALVRDAKGRSMPVAVSGAFHSPYMAEASENLAAYLAEGHAPAAPQVPVIANRTAEAYPAGNATEDATARAALLAEQVSHPVQWVRTLHELESRGIDTFIEVGPGKTLTGLVKRTLKGATALTCETPEQLDAVLEALGMTDAKEA